MHRLSPSFLVQALILFDTAAVAACLGFAMFVSATGVSHAVFADFLSVRISVRNAVLVAVFLLACHRTFRYFGLYRSWRLGSRRSLYVQIGKAASTAALLLGAASMLFRIEAFDRAFLAVFWASSAAVIAAS